MPAKSLELKYTIKLIQEISSKIDEIEQQIELIMNKINSPITTIPSINLRMGAMILADLSPTTYQSGQLDSSYSHMEKHEFRYLRYALFNAAKYVCIWDPTFSTYLAKNERKVNITMLQFLMRQKTCESYLPTRKNRDSLI